MRCSLHKIVLLLYILEFASGSSHMSSGLRMEVGTVLSAPKTQVFTIPTFDSAFKWILSFDEVRPSFFKSFIPGLIIQSSERLDDHMNPLRKSQLLRNFLNDEGTSRIIKNYPPLGPMLYGNMVVKNGLQQKMITPQLS
jgi:hypothetical protein